MALIHAYVYGKVDEIQNEFQITGADVFTMPKLELTNMVMIQNEHTGKVLVQDRIKSWKGLSFPGGHIEEKVL